MSLRYIRAFPAAMNDDAMMEAHRSLLLLPSTQPQCTGCHYCNRGLRRKHCDKILAASTLDGAELDKMRLKILGAAPKRLSKPLEELSSWPAPQDEFPRALFHELEFNAHGIDAANNSVLDCVRKRDLEDAIGAYQRLPRLQVRAPAPQDPGGFQLDPAILSVKVGSWHRMAKPDGSEVFVIYNFIVHAQDVEIYQFSERYSSALHRHSLLMENALETETVFPAKQWWKNMIDDDENILRRGEGLRAYFEHVVRTPKILKHPKARSILGYNFSMLQTYLMQSQHGHWIEHDLRARSAIERSNGKHDQMRTIFTRTLTTSRYSIHIALLSILQLAPCFIIFCCRLLVSMTNGRLLCLCCRRRGLCTKESGQHCATSWCDGNRRECN